MEESKEGCTKMTCQEVIKNSNFSTNPSQIKSNLAVAPQRDNLLMMQKNKVACAAQESVESLKYLKTAWGSISPNNIVFAFWPSNNYYYPGIVKERSLFEWIVDFDDGDIAKLSEADIIPIKILGVGIKVVYCPHGQDPVYATVFGQRLFKDPDIGETIYYAIKLAKGKKKGEIIWCTREMLSIKDHDAQILREEYQNQPTNKRLSGYVNPANIQPFKRTRKQKNLTSSDNSEDDSSDSEADKVEYRKQTVKHNKSQEAKSQHQNAEQAVANEEVDKIPTQIAFQKESDQFMPLKKETSSMYNFYDAKLRCGTELIPVQKCILAWTSPVFREMFDIEMKKEEFVIEDVDAKILKLMIKWIYTKNIEVLDLQDRMDLFKAAHRYQIESLKDWSISQICAAISPENVLAMYELGESYEEIQIQRKAREIMKANKDIVFVSGDTSKEFALRYPMLMLELIRS